MTKPKLETVFSFGNKEEHELQYDPISGMMYLNGEKFITEKRWGIAERRIAYFGLVIAAIGVAATVVQAGAAIWPSPATNYQTCLHTFERAWIDANGQFTGQDRLGSLSACQNAL